MSEQELPPPSPQPPPAPGASVGGCLAGLCGFALGFFGTAVVIAAAGGGLGQVTDGSFWPGVAMLLLSLAMIAFAIRYRRQAVAVPLLQGMMIGAAVASLLTGLCGAILVLAK